MNTGSRRARVVVAHDWLCGMRGGEQVLERIVALVDRAFEAAGLLVMFDDGKPLSPTVDAWRSRGLVRASRWNFVGKGPLRRWLLPLYPNAVAGLSRTLADMHREQPVDLLISTSSAGVKGLRTPSGIPHLCYCHSPARYVWSRRADYRLGGGVKARLRQLGLDVYARRFAAWDRATAANVSRFIANSTHTAAEIRRCFGAESIVIHPPVRTRYFTPDASVQRSHFWLVVGAIEPYKRVDLAIEAAAIAGAHLVIAGSGSHLRSIVNRHGGERGDLETLMTGTPKPGPRVEFVGRVDDPTLRQLYRRAGVLIFPQVEDFGIIAAEAQACGTPVVARGEGGALDILMDGRTGRLFCEASPQTIAAAVGIAPSNCDSACQMNASRFSEDRFDAAILAEINHILAPTASGASSRQ